jgi:hypothetical protein
MKRLVPLVTLMTAACATSPLPPAPAINRDLAAAPFASLPVATIAPVPDDWWRLYDDPVLDQLVEASLAANADLRVAYANLDGARAALRLSEAEGMCARVIAGCTSGVTKMLIPFSRLYLSDANVRKTRSEEDDIQLSADIEARGLLQNLLVTKSKKRGKFAVIAGGRRLRAIEMIVARGAWTPDAEIECKLLEGSEEEAGEALRRGSRAN